MGKLLLFTLGNLLAGWSLSLVLESQLHYPPDIPIRLQPQMAALLTGLFFSLIGFPISWLKARLRTPLIVLSMPVSLAATGATLFSLDRAAGALIALEVAHNSPLALAAGAGWGLIWSLLVYRPSAPPPPPPTPPVREDLPVSDNWSGSER
ncbi:MAG: hypothetical protein U0931_36995 [Vulcanimicrobiota bacterium]